MFCNAALPAGRLGILDAYEKSPCEYVIETQTAAACGCAPSCVDKNCGADGCGECRMQPGLSLRLPQQAAPPAAATVTEISDCSSLRLHSCACLLVHAFVLQATLLTLVSWRFLLLLLTAGGYCSGKTLQGFCPSGQLCKKVLGNKAGVCCRPDCTNR